MNYKTNKNQTEFYLALQSALPAKRQFVIFSIVKHIVNHTNNKILYYSYL